MTAIRSINGISPQIEPAKGGYRVNKSDLYSDSTGRSSETGAMIQYLIRRNIVTIELTYSSCLADIAAIEELISSSQLTVEYLDNGSYSTKTMYPSDRAKDITSLKGRGWATLSFSLIEL